jgi:hypothetical protein
LRKEDSPRIYRQGQAAHQHGSPECGYYQDAPIFCSQAVSP